jgi:tRNA 2-thiouridine synthesizing protein A
MDDNMNNEAIRILDLKGLKCPLPVLKAAKAMKALPAETQMWVETTDPMAVIDIPAFCNEHGHSLLETQEKESTTRFLIEKAKA